MELELDQLALRGKDLDQKIKICNQVLQNAEKYERLIGDEDFKAYLQEIRQIAEFHQLQIEQSCDGLWDKNLQERNELNDRIYTHQIMKDMALACADRPRKAVEEAKDARKRLVEFETEAKDIKGVTHAY